MCLKFPNGRDASAESEYRRKRILKDNGNFYYTRKRKDRSRRAEDMKGVIRKLEGLLEIIVLTYFYYVMWNRYYRGDEVPAYNGNGKYLLMLIYAVLILVLFVLCDSFKYGHRKLTEVVISQWISILFVDIVTYFQMSLIANHLLNPLPYVGLVVIDVVFTWFASFIFTKVYHQIYVPKNMVMIYGSDKAIDLKFKMDTRRDKYRITKVISYEEGVDKIKEEISRHDAVIINDLPAKTRNDILKYCYANQVRTYVVPKISDIITRGAEEINLFDTPLLLVKGRGLNSAQKLVKRIMDIVLSVIALIPGLPIMAVVAICIKAEDGGPVFYRQERVTEGGKVFRIIKFRSMVVDAEKEGKSIPATENDPRITKVGRVLRASRLDELPQILNILGGAMSWVGPRPERVEHMQKYCEEVPEFALRLKVKGGLTGYAQIYGKYNTSAYDKLRLDLMYIENYSIFLDIKLLFMTLQILFKRESTEGFDKAEEIAEKRDELLAGKEKAGREEDRAGGNAGAEAAGAGTEGIDAGTEN